MSRFCARISGETRALPKPALCDAWLADGQRFGDELPGLDGQSVLGRWPDELETGAVVRLAQTLGDTPTWEAYAATPPVAQKLAERARPQPLDLEILRHLQHLQHVCHRPRLHLRLEEERLPVSRARRIPVCAVADLVSHPGDWEHRTLRSIQPSRVLTHQSEDEWNLYENRVAARLVDHLLAYLTKRLEELRKLKEILDASRDHSDEFRRTSFRRAQRISALWSSALESMTEEELSRIMSRLELAHRDLQALLGAPLYKRVPRRQSVALSLKPTNILVNDSHYRKVAALWRSWAKFGHRRQETRQQRAERRQAEAAAWDRFVLHLVVRGFVSLGWSARAQPDEGWELTRPGWLPVRVIVDSLGMVTVANTSAKATTSLRVLPLCTSFAGTDMTALARELEAMDALEGELVIAHVGAPVHLADADRATGWSFGRRTVMFACSPWGIDSEERMARLLHGWLNRAAAFVYPVTGEIRVLPDPPRDWDWLVYTNPYLVVLRAPNEEEVAAARTWAEARATELDRKAHQAKLARHPFEVAPREALTAFEQYVDEAGTALAGLNTCPVCGDPGRVEPRPGKHPDGSDATWWAYCRSCDSEWGLRPCVSCGNRYRALVPRCGIDLACISEATPPHAWPDKIIGCDVWAQPCATGAPGQFRCPDCGQCSGAHCTRCRA